MFAVAISQLEGPVQAIKQAGEGGRESSQRPGQPPRPEEARR